MAPRYGPWNWVGYCQFKKASCYATERNRRIIWLTLSRSRMPLQRGFLAAQDCWCEAEINIWVCVRDESDTTLSLSLVIGAMASSDDLLCGTGWLKSWHKHTRWVCVGGVHLPNTHIHTHTHTTWTRLTHKHTYTHTHIHTHRPVSNVLSEMSAPRYSGGVCPDRHWSGSKPTLPSPAPTYHGHFILMSPVRMAFDISHP